MRPLICAANWKLNKNPEETKAFFLEWNQMVPKNEQRHFLFFPPAVNLAVTQAQLSETDFGWGAQNVYFENSGAFTGETSCETTKSMGATHALVGHSERRSLFDESNEVVAKKVNCIQESNLCPVICVGESLEERESGQTNEVVVEQLLKALAGSQAGKEFIVAYEPVWAIGTGKVATPEQAEEVHQVLRSALASHGGEGLAEKTVILYGGSVKPENAKELSQQPNIDGFLVGGASLKPQSFYEIFAQSQG